MVALRQLIALGVSPRGVTHRAAAGRLHRIHHGVYAVGHVLLTRHGRWMAAVLACGEGAGLRDDDAAALWGIRTSDAARIDVIVPRPVDDLELACESIADRSSPASSSPRTASRSPAPRARSSTSPRR